MFPRRTAAQHCEAEIQTYTQQHALPADSIRKGSRDKSPSLGLRTGSAKNWGREFMLEESASWSPLGRASGVTFELGAGHTGVLGLWKLNKLRT